jgi:hypothetical protein
LLASTAKEEPFAKIVREAACAFTVRSRVRVKVAAAPFFAFTVDSKIRADRAVAEVSVNTTTTNTGAKNAVVRQLCRCNQPLSFSGKNTNKAAQLLALHRRLLCVICKNCSLRLLNIKSHCMHFAV